MFVLAVEVGVPSASVHFLPHCHAGFCLNQRLWLSPHEALYAVE